MSSVHPERMNARESSAERQESAGVADTIEEMVARRDVLRERLDSVGEEGKFIERAHQLTGASKEQLVGQLSEEGWDRRLRQLGSRAGRLKLALRVGLLVGLLSLFGPNEGTAQEGAGQTSYAAQAVDAIAVASEQGLGERPFVRLERDIQSLVHDGEREWLLVFGQSEDGETRMLAKIEGSETGVSALAPDAFVRAFEESGYGSEHDQLLSTHNHSFSSWRSLLTDPTYRQWHRENEPSLAPHVGLSQAGLGMESNYDAGIDFPEEEFLRQVEAMRSGEVPPIFLPPSLLDMHRLIELAIADTYQDRVKTHVFGPSGIWSIEVDVSIMEKGFGADMYHIIMADLEGRPVPRHLKEQHAIWIEEYQSLHSVLVAPYSEKAMDAVGGGDASLAEKEHEKKKEKLKRLTRVAQNLGLVVELVPYENAQEPTTPKEGVRIAKQ